MSFEAAFSISLQRKVLEWIRKKLSPARFRHVLSVQRLAVRLAGIHGEDPQRASLAALLHDLAKEFPDKKLAAYAKRHLSRNGEMKRLSKTSPSLLHGFVSADIARREFGIKDREIFSAISWHTLGKPVMTRLEKILYIADIAEPKRHFREATAIRRLAQKNLDKALMRALAVKISFVVKNGDYLEPLSVSAYNRHVA